MHMGDTLCTWEILYAHGREMGYFIDLYSGGGVGIHDIVLYFYLIILP